MKEMHPIQLQILKKLLFSPKLKYSQLKPSDNIENNQFNFHLEQLIKEMFIEKRDGLYTLSNEGKEFANRMDTESVTIKRQAKISVAIFPVREMKGKREYLIYTRLKQPFYGCQGFMSGKVPLGEAIVDAAKREFKEETNLEGELQLFCIKHFRVYDTAGDKLLEDKLMFFYLAQNPTGELIPNNEGTYEWVKEKDIFTYVTNHFVSMEEFQKDIQTVNSFDGTLQFLEIEQYSDKF
jgi:ADP-ribose pyrophosphatase YjhB (NUDIX family)